MEMKASIRLNGLAHSVTPSVSDSSPRSTWRAGALASKRSIDRRNVARWVSTLSSSSCVKT
jgi:hypothetical protein